MCNPANEDKKSTLLCLEVNYAKKSMVACQKLLSPSAFYIVDSPFWKATIEILQQNTHDTVDLNGSPITILSGES